MEAEQDARTDLAVLRAPWVWPDYPYLQVERRTETRPGQPFCVVVADETGEVMPAVYFVDDFPPVAGVFDPSQAWGFSYSDLEAVVADGWTLVGNAPVKDEIDEEKSA